MDRRAATWSDAHQLVSFLLTYRTEHFECSCADGADSCRLANQDSGPKRLQLLAANVLRQPPVSIDPLRFDDRFLQDHAFADHRSGFLNCRPDDHLTIFLLPLSFREKPDMASPVYSRYIHGNWWQPSPL